MLLKYLKKNEKYEINMKDLCGAGQGILVIPTVILS